MTYTPPHRMRWRMNQSLTLLMIIITSCPPTYFSSVARSLSCQSAARPTTRLRSACETYTGTCPRPKRLRNFVICTTRTPHGCECSYVPSLHQFWDSRHHHSGTTPYLSLSSIPPFILLFSNLSRHWRRATSQTQWFRIGYQLCLWSLPSEV